MLLTNDQFKDWIKSGATITKEEYSTLAKIVEESFEWLYASHIRGSKIFNKAFEEEMDLRHNLMEKLRYYADIKI